MDQENTRLLLGVSADDLFSGLRGGDLIFYRQHRAAPLKSLTLISLRGKHFISIPEIPTRMQNWGSNILYWYAYLPTYLNIKIRKNLFAF